MSDTASQDPGFRFDSVESIEAVVRAFEGCTVQPAFFTHRAHLTVTLVYLLRYPEAEAEARLRAGLRRFIAHHGVDGYNETMTAFWLRRAKACLAGQDRTRPLPDLLAALFAACGPAAGIYQYFSKPYLTSPELRAAWRDPDLKPLDF